ncbi:MAG: LysR family transcriptional regulator [Oscillospiraceae bacterium]|nr:LysR family transcriptional regulator [Oscillospiraceae bacterium]
MNYNYLRYFSVLAQVEHYTLAAARLGISQPSLSSAIHALEDELGGVKLFEKVGRNIRLTEEGRYYREQVDAALLQLHNASQTLHESKNSAPVVVRLGLVSGALDSLVSQEVTNYARQNPRVRFQLTESSAESLMDMVRQEKLDMALVDTTNRDRSLHFRKLCEQNFYVALPADHPYASRSRLLYQDLQGQPQVTFHYDVDNTFEQWAAGHDEKNVCAVNTAQAALSMVASGFGFCFLPESCVQPREGVVFVPLENWHQALYMCILYDKWLEPPIWGFCEGLVKVFRSQPKAENNNWYTDI